MIKSVLIIWVVYSLVVVTFGQSEIPEKPQSWVNDYADVLSASEERDLEAMLSGLEKRSSNQIFIGIFQKLPDNYYLEDFTVKLYDKWRPGLPDQDNGILIVIFIDDRKMRIEVGYGLEDVVTDAQSGTVINEYMAPNFRNDDYYAGLKSALNVLIPAAEGKYKIPLKTSKSTKSKKSPFSWIITLFIIFLVMSRLLGRRRSAAYGSRRRSAGYIGPFFFGGGGGGSSFGGGGGFSGGFGGMSGGGGASGSW